MEKEWWHDRFNQFDVKLTGPRKAIINELHSTIDHLSAEDIYLGVHKKNPSIGLTTVYRTLDLLSQMGIVQRFDFGDGKTRYELTDDPEGKGHHHHLVCMKCKRIIDYTDYIDDELELIKKTEKKLSKKHKFDIITHMIHFYGLCEKCRK